MRINPLMIPVRHKLLPLTIINTTELYFSGKLIDYLIKLKNSILGRRVE